MLNSDRCLLIPDDTYEQANLFSQMLTPQVIGIGSATGDIIVPNSRLYELIGSRPATTWLEQIGIHCRRFLSPDKPIEYLAVRALIALLLNYLAELPKDKFTSVASAIFLGIDIEQAATLVGKARLQVIREVYPDDAIACAVGPLVLANVQAVVVSTSTLEDLLIPTGGVIQAALKPYGLPKSVPCQTLNNVCAGFGFAVDVATGYLHRGYQQVLIIALDAYSKILNLLRHDTAPLFGDLATAVLLSRPTNPSLVHGLDLRILPYFALWTDGEISQFISRSGSENYPFFEMDPKTVSCFSKHVVTLFQEYLNRLGLSLSQVDLVIPHQPQLEILRSLAKTIGIHQLVNIDSKGLATVEQCCESMQNDSKIVWIGNELANGGVAASPTALNFALAAHNLTTGERLVNPKQDKPVIIMMLGFGGGANVYAMSLVALQPGTAWTVKSEQVDIARKGNLVPVFHSSNSVDLGALLLNAVTASRAPYPDLPQEVILSHKIEHLQRRGEAWDQSSDPPYSFEEVAVIGFGRRGVDKVIEISRMPDNHVIYVFTRNHQRFRESLEQIRIQCQDEVWQKLHKRIRWFSSSELESILTSNSAIQLVFEIAPEDVKIELLSRIWSVRSDLCVITNTSSRHILNFSTEAATIAARKTFFTEQSIADFVKIQLNRVIAQHDHYPNTNRLDNISDPQKRPIDSRLYASVKVFCQLNNKVVDFVDDRYPMYGGNRIVFGGLLREVFRLLSKDGYSPVAIREAALKDEPWHSHFYNVPLPPVGFDPVQLADEVGLKLTQQVLESYDEYYGSGRGVLDSSHFAVLLACTQNCFYNRETGIYQWQIKESRLALKTLDGQPLLSESALKYVKLHETTNEQKIEIRERLWLSLMAEYFRLIEDGVLRHPRYGDFELTWFALNKRTGGSLQLADNLGLPELVSRMRFLATLPGQNYFAPTETILDLSKTGKTFAIKYDFPSDIAQQGDIGSRLTWAEEYKHHAHKYTVMNLCNNLY